MRGRQRGWEEKLSRPSRCSHAVVASSYRGQAVCKADHLLWDCSTTVTTMWESSTRSDHILRNCSNTFTWFESLLRSCSNTVTWCESLLRSCNYCYNDFRVGNPFKKQWQPTKLIKCKEYHKQPAKSKVDCYALKGVCNYLTFMRADQYMWIYISFLKTHRSNNTHTEKRRY